MSTEFGNLKLNSFIPHIPRRWSGRLGTPRVLFSLRSNIAPLERNPRNLYNPRQSAIQTIDKYLTHPPIQSSNLDLLDKQRRLD